MCVCRDARCVDSKAGKQSQQGVLPIDVCVCVCVCAEMPGVLTAKLVSRASRVSSKGSVEAAAASRLQS